MKKYIYPIMFTILFLLTSCSPAELESTPNEPVEQNETSEELENVEDGDTTAENLGDLTVHYIDAGQADATLFELSNEKESYTILYDTGDWNKNDVTEYLMKQQITEIDLVIVSHPHADHIGQLENIMKNFDVGEVWMSGDETSSDTFTRAIQAVIDSEADYHEPRAGEQYELGALQIDVLHPAELRANNLNANSISLLFTYRDHSFLFTGDAERREEKEMLNRFSDLSADILHLGHHGSNTSSDPDFIRAVNPQIAIYSAGENNSYGHPSADVIDFIEQLNIDIYGTDVHGHIIVTTDGNEWTIQTEKEGEIQPDQQTKEHTRKEMEHKHHEPSEQPSDGTCISINEASIEELQQIIHIGPQRAEDIVEHRPYHTVDDLQKINGIGPARIADIKEQGVACP